MSLDESDWLGEGQKSDASSEEEERPKVQPRRGRGARDPPPQQSQQVKEPPKRQKQTEPPKEGQMSYWLDGVEQQEEPAVGLPKNVRGKKFQAEMSFNLQPEELQPDKHIETSWIAPEKSKPPQQNRGNRGNREPPRQDKPKEQPKEEEEAPGPRRGNRQPASFQKKQPYGADQGSSNYRPGNERRYENHDQGYRGRGRGRGRGGGRGGYQGRQGQQDNEGRFSRNDPDGSYKKRDNQQYRAKTFENETEEQPRRGNRNDNYRPYNNNRGNGHNYRQYDNRDSDRPYNNYNNNRNYNYNQSNYNRDRDYNRDYDRENQTKKDTSDEWSRGDNNRQYNRQPNFAKKTYVETETAKPASRPVSQPSPQNVPSVATVLEKEEPLVPKGRHCWPESSIYILGCRFSVSFRPIAQFRAKLLVIPYASLKMEYYPGNIINSSEVDYKARILAKGDKISSAGEVYLQKAVSVGNFVALAFLKIDQKRVNDSLKRGIKKLLTMVQSVEGAELSSLLFPICQQLGSVDTVISSFQENLENCSRVKEVYVMTNQRDCFMDAMKIFLGTVKEMLDQNKVLIH